MNKTKQWIPLKQSHPKCRRLDPNIQVRRHTVMKFVSERPIYRYCREAERRRGSGSHLYWWNQPMELEETSAEAEAAAEANDGG